MDVGGPAGSEQVEVPESQSIMPSKSAGELHNVFPMQDTTCRERPDIAVRVDEPPAVQDRAVSPLED